MPWQPFETLWPGAAKVDPGRQIHEEVTIPVGGGCRAASCTGLGAWRAGRIGGWGRALLCGVLLRCCVRERAAPRGVVPGRVLVRRGFWAAGVVARFVRCRQFLRCRAPLEAGLCARSQSATARVDGFSREGGSGAVLRTFGYGAGASAGGWVGLGPGG